MKTLNIESGLQQYNLNDKVAIEFSPTDMAFLERVVNVFKQADAKQKDIEQELKGASTDELFEIAKRRDTEMRELVDGLFGVSICEPLFGAMNVFARAGGFPLWANVLTAVLDECYDNLPEEDKATRERVAKYTRKYKKK